MENIKIIPFNIMMLSTLADMVRDAWHLEKSIKNKFYSSFSPLSIRFVRIPKINAQATVLISTAPKLTTIPPTPVIKITLATKRLRFLLRSTFWNILKPETAMNP